MFIKIDNCTNYENLSKPSISHYSIWVNIHQIVDIYELKHNKGICLNKMNNSIKDEDTVIQMTAKDFLLFIEKAKSNEYFNDAFKQEILKD